MKKKLLIFSILLLCVIPIFSFALESSTENTDSIKNIEVIVQNRTPGFISGPIITLADGIEQFRLAMAEIGNKETARISLEIKALEEKNSPAQKGSQSGSKFKLLWNRILLFFCSILTYILNTKWAFYTSLFVFIILALRYILWFIFP